MKRDSCFPCLPLFLGAILLCSLGERAWAQVPPASAPFRAARLPVEQRVADLLGRMTLEEKVAQTRCVYQKSNALRDEQGNFSAAKAALLLQDGIGQHGTIAVPPRVQSPADEARFANDVQRWLVEKTRLGIPVIFHGEGLHGFMAQDATSFPVPIGLASTWDPDLVREVFTVVAAEARARGIQQLFSPVLDVARDPRWGRTEETYGEDPYLISRMGVACIQAMQGAEVAIDQQHVIATAKHFAGHGGSEGGRNCAPSNHSEREYREFLLPSFKAAVMEAGVRAVMPSYNEIDGIPSHVNRWLLQKVLREEWGFQGLVVSDYSGIEEMIPTHRVAATLEDAAQRALEAGVQVNGPDGEAYATLVQQVRTGRVAVATLDHAVAAVLRAKFQLGLFENPYVDPERADRVCRLPERRELALKAAHEAVVLLKNQASLLPLDRAKIKSIAVIGPCAASVRLGAYSGTTAYAVSVLDGIKRKLGPAVQVLYAEGCAITEGNPPWWEKKIIPPDPKLDARRIAEAVAVARTADVVVVAVGDNNQTAREGPGDGDRDCLDLIGMQDELVKAMVGLGKPTIMVLIAGRPTSILYAAGNVPAILGCWSLGQETGNAVADVLFGDYNPGGKLPITFPRTVGQIPAYYNHKHSARQAGYALSVDAPLFPFGHGLSYTTFKYDNLRLEPEKIGPQGQTTVRADVTNTGGSAGDEVVQMYIQDQVSSVARPVQELKGFRRISLAPGETRTVEFTLGPEALSFYDEEMRPVVEPGKFDVMVGGSSADFKKTVLEVSSR